VILTSATEGNTNGNTYSVLGARRKRQIIRENQKGKCQVINIPKENII
jgi:hypothetical protein